MLGQPDDVTDVFRRFEELPSVLAETLALEPRPKTLWLQRGLRSKIALSGR
jgi:uncharacterized protein